MAYVIRICMWKCGATSGGEIGIHVGEASTFKPVEDFSITSFELPGSATSVSLIHYPLNFMESKLCIQTRAGPNIAEIWGLRLWQHAGLSGLWNIRSKEYLKSMSGMTGRVIASLVKTCLCATIFISHMGHPASLASVPNCYGRAYDL
jgi:hypothetical protein